MKKRRKVAMLLLICVLLSLVGCGKEESDNRESAQVQKFLPENMPTESALADTHVENTVPTKEGWLMTRVDMPQKMQASAAIASDADCVWISGRILQENNYQIALLGLNTNDEPVTESQPIESSEETTPEQETEVPETDSDGETEALE